MTQAEILSIGNEVLNGDVVDTNSNWLARQVARRGGHVRRMTTLPDEVETIGQALADTLARRPDLVLCTGGLGPTADDLTLAGIAHGAGRPLVEDEAALEMVRRRYDDLAIRGYVEPGLNEGRRKMAWLPQGATPLWNSVGGAPGVRLDVGPTVIVAMPGVPEEMKAIFLESLGDLLAERLPLAYAERAGQAHMQDDSRLAPHHQAVSAAFPDVYIKTRVQVFGTSDVIRITFATSAPIQAQAEARVDAAFAAMTATLAEAGIQFSPEAG